MLYSQVYIIHNSLVHKYTKCNLLYQFRSKVGVIKLYVMKRKQIIVRHRWRTDGQEFLWWNMSVSMRESPIICRQTITYSHRARVIFHMKSVSESEHVFLRRTSERMKNDVCEENAVHCCMMGRREEVWVECKLVPRPAIIGLIVCHVVYRGRPAGAASNSIVMYCLPTCAECKCDATPDQLRRAVLPSRGGFTESICHIILTCVATRDHLAVIPAKMRR